jgi:hypothetical protein
VQLAAEDEERVSINDELSCGATLFEVGSGALLRGQMSCLKSCDEQESWQRKVAGSHIGRESSTRLCDFPAWLMGAGEDQLT